MRETIDRKALRLLAAGRVRVLRADRNAAQVAVRGDSGKYLVHVDRGEASCECPSRARCSHETAALLVVAAGLPSLEAR